MQNIDCPMDNIAQTITDLLHNRGVLFSTIDLLFAYNQLPLDRNAVINAISTSKAYKPLEHTDSIQVFAFLQACLQKAIDSTLANIANTFCFWDDIIIALGGSETIEKKTTTASTNWMKKPRHQPQKMPTPKT